MKLRIQGNSLRLRLSEAEVSQFADAGQVQETIAFSPDETNALHYTLQKTNEKEVSVRFSYNVITINIPDTMAQKWTDTDLVGFDDLIDLGNEKQLRIVVEKDLDCRH